MAIKKIPITNEMQRNVLQSRANPVGPQPVVHNLSVGMPAEFNSEMYTIVGMRNEGNYDILYLDLLADDLSHVFAGVPADQTTVPTQTTADMREGEEDEDFSPGKTGS